MPGTNQSEKAFGLDMAQLLKCCLQDTLHIKCTSVYTFKILIDTKSILIKGFLCRSMMAS